MHAHELVKIMKNYKSYKQTRNGYVTNLIISSIAWTENDSGE